MKYIKYFKQTVDHSKRKKAHVFIIKLFKILYGKFGASYYFLHLKYNVEADAVKIYIEDITDRDSNEPAGQALMFH